MTETDGQKFDHTGLLIVGVDSCLIRTFVIMFRTGSNYRLCHDLKNREK